MTDLKLLALYTLLTWVLLLTASLVRAKGWTPAGLLIAFGNRDQLPDPTAFAGRAERTAKNSLENLPLFIAVVVAARLGGGSVEAITRGATIFFWARVVYTGVYLAGIPYLRTAVWSVSIAGLLMIGAQVF